MHVEEAPRIRGKRTHFCGANKVFAHWRPVPDVVRFVLGQLWADNIPEVELSCRPRSTRIFPLRFGGQAKANGSQFAIRSNAGWVGGKL